MTIARALKEMSKGTTRLHEIREKFNKKVRDLFIVYQKFMKDISLEKYKEKESDDKNGTMRWRINDFFKRKLECVLSAWRRNEQRHNDIKRKT